MELSYQWSHDPWLPPSPLLLGTSQKACCKWTVAEVGCIAGTPELGKNNTDSGSRAIPTLNGEEIFHIVTNTVGTIIIWVKFFIQVLGIVVIVWVSHYFLLGISSRYRAVNDNKPPEIVSLHWILKRKSEH